MFPIWRSDASGLLLLTLMEPYFGKQSSLLCTEEAVGRMYVPVSHPVQRKLRCFPLPATHDLALLRRHATLAHR